MRIGAPLSPLAAEVLTELRKGLERCPDVAFAHLPEVRVEAHQSAPNLVLFVWLRPAALRSLRSALNLVSEVVARILPPEEFVDVVILNSAPELLDEVEAANCLIAEPDPEEHRRALDAARAGDADVAPRSAGSSWWPF
jgi:hypothetical protein